MPFHEFLLPVRVVFGEGSLGQLGALLPTLAPRTALVVTDPGVAATLSVARVLQQLRGAGVEPALFSAVESNPSVEVVRAGLAAGRQARPDCFIAVGGGSVIDTAKAINLLLAHGGEIEDYVGRDRLTQPLRPLVAIPTTAGTGSEVSMVAIISDRKGRKMVIVDPHLLPWLALVDPEVTYSCPVDRHRRDGCDYARGGVVHLAPRLGRDGGALLARPAAPCRAHPCRRPGRR